MNIAELIEKEYYHCDAILLSKKLSIDIQITFGTSCYYGITKDKYDLFYKLICDMVDLNIPFILFSRDHKDEDYLILDKKITNISDNDIHFAANTFILHTINMNIDDEKIKMFKLINTI